MDRERTTIHLSYHLIVKFTDSGNVDRLRSSCKATFSPFRQVGLIYADQRVKHFL